MKRLMAQAELFSTRLWRGAARAAAWAVIAAPGVVPEAWSLCGVALAQPCGTIEGLGTFGGKTGNALDVSLDGGVVVGYAKNTVGFGNDRAFRWTAAGGLQDLGTLGGSTSHAYGVSGDGGVVVGDAVTGTFAFHAFRWTEPGGMEDLGTLGGTKSEAWGVSTDGSIVVGQASASGTSPQRAFRWTAGTGMQDLGILPGGTASWARGVSDDGNVVVGQATNAGGSLRAFLWTPTGGMVDLGVLGGASPTANTEAWDVSGDGSVVVGRSLLPGGFHAFRWTAASGMQDLGTLGGASSAAYGVSRDGAFVVGDAFTASGQQRAFRWSAAEGMVELIGTLGGPSSQARDVNRDGTVAVGQSDNATFDFNAFRWAYCDLDQDGIYDDWEVNGVPYTKSDGTTGFYELVGADPTRKDLFVEIDAMAGRAPQQLTIDKVINAFDLSPVPPPVGVPGGQGGVSLHAFVDDESLPLAAYGADYWADFQSDKQAWFGSFAERVGPDAAALLEAKRKVYRYCIFADTYGGTSSSGVAEGITCDDFMVTLGAWSPAGGTEDEQAGTFMHELGHTLGLRHGGADDTNYKPNYNSAMNYLWQLPTGYGNVGPGNTFVLRYAEGPAWPTLKEDALVESAGIGGDYLIHIPFIAPDGGGGCTVPHGPGCVRYAFSVGAVDWNNDGDPSTPGTLPDTMNINAFNDDPSAAPAMQELKGHDDWSNLKYDFKGSPFSAPGATAPPGPPEMTFETYEFLASLPPPPPTCYADCDGTGDLSIDDFNCFQTFFALGDPYVDCDGDSALSIDDFICFQTFFAIGC